jgi:hypothetical protein
MVAGAPLQTTRKKLMWYAFANCFVFLPVPRPLGMPPRTTGITHPFEGDDRTLVGWRNCMSRNAAIVGYWIRRGWLWLSIHMKQRVLFLTVLWLPSPILWFFAAIICFASKSPPDLLPLGKLTSGARMAGTCPRSNCFGQYPINFAQTTAVCFVFYCVTMLLLIFAGFKSVRRTIRCKDLCF